jgi:two-component system response regulator (stage 0 sporulation protein F)
MATVLIIDDETSVRNVVRSALRSAGYEVMEASNGRIGISLFRQRRPDLVIADIHMPELNGLDVIIELTREFLDVKVIAISGMPEHQRLLDAAKLLGARQTLNKPFSIEELLNAVRYELAH